MGVASLGYIETTPRIQALGTFKHLAHSSTWHIQALGTFKLSAQKGNHATKRSDCVP